jgi:hypothetical protein
MAVTSVSGLTTLWTVSDGDWTAAAVAGAANAANAAEVRGNVGIDGSSDSLQITSDNISQPAGLTSAWWDFGTSVDISGDKQHIVFHCFSDSSFSFISTASDGIRVALFSGGGTSEYAVWNLGGQNDPIYPKDSVWKLVHVGLTTPDSETASYDNTDITGVAMLYDLTATGAFFLSHLIDQVVYVDSEVTIADGEVANPASWDEVNDIMKADSTDDRRTLLFRRGGIGYESFVSFRNEATYWRSDTRAIGFAFEDDAERAYPVGFFSLDCVPPVSGDINMSTTLVGSGNVTKVDMEIDETNGTIIYDTNTIKDINLVEIDGGDLRGSTLSGNEVAVEITSAPAGTWTLADSVGDGIRIVGAAGDYSALEAFLDSSITGNELVVGSGGAGTYDLRGITASHSINVHNESATNAVTVQLDPDVTATSSTAGGSITIDNAVTVSVKVTAKELDGTNIQGAQVYLEADSGGTLPSADSVTITRSGSTATVTHTNHGLSTSDEVTIRDSDQNEYNGIKTITVTGTNTYTYSVSGTPTTPATGTITSTYVILSDSTNVNGEVEDTNFVLSGTQPVKGTVRKSSSAPFFKPSPLSGNISSGGYDQIAFLSSD